MKGSINMKENKKILWKEYCNYLIDWVADHSDLTCDGMSPACYDEWKDNEYMSEDENESEVY